MPTSTLHLNLVKPDPTEAAKTVTYNANLDKLEKGRTVRGIANESQVAFDAVRWEESTGRWRKALDTDTVAHMRGLAQIAAAALATQYGQIDGIATNGAWTWTVGNLIYVSASTAGALTATAPTPSSVPIGVAISATEVWLTPNEHIERLRRGLKWDQTNRALIITISGAVTYRGITLEQYSVDGVAGLFTSRKSKNAVEGSHTAVQNLDELVSLVGEGSDGTAFQTGVLIRGAATETWSATARGSRILFTTVANGTTALLERLGIEHDGRVNAKYSFALSGDITPSSLSASQNDYNPTGLADAACIRQASSAAVSITGLAGGADGRIITIMNVNTAATAITMTAEDAASAAANRFDLAANVVLAAREAITLRYDATLTRWRTVGGKG